MARIELTNVTAGGGGGSTTLGLTTTGTSGASLLSAIPGGYILNIPVYQGALTLTTTGSGAATLVGNTLNIPTPASSTAAGSTGEVQYNGGSGAFAASPNLFWASGTNRLGIGTNTPAQTLEVSGAMRLTGTAGTADFMLGRSSAGDVSTVTLGTTGTSGAATLSANVLNIPQYQGALTLTTTGTSGAATLVGNTLNIPQYSGGGGGTPAGNAGEVQFNSTPAGSFAASANLSWDNTATQLNIGAPSGPTGKLNVKGGGTTSATVNLRLTDSGNTELLKVLDDGSTNIGTDFNWDNANVRLGIGISSPTSTLQIKGANALTTSSSFVLQSTSTTLLDVRNDGRFIISNIIIEPLNSVSFLRFKGSGGRYYNFGMSESDSATSGTSSFVINTKGFNPSSGSAVFNGYTYQGVINQTGTASGVTRGLYIQPTLTSAPDWRSIEWNNNSGYGLYGIGTANNYLAGDTAIGTTTPSARLHIRGSNTSSGTNALLVQNSTPSDIYKIENDGKISYWATNTAAGTTGAQTIDRPSGTVNFAAGATALVVTNSLCTTASLVFAEVRTNDATAQIKNVVPAAGSFTINLSAAATAETSVGFFIIN